MFKIRKRILFASLATFFLFALFTVLVKTVDVASANVIASKVSDTKIGFSSINIAFFNATHPTGEYSLSWYDFTDVLGKIVLLEAVGFAAFGAYQLVKKKSLKKIDADLYSLAAIYLLLGVFYVAFELFPVNYRPVLIIGNDAAEASYPSSHTMLACTIVGTGIVFLNRKIKSKLTRVSVDALSGTVVFVTVLGRTLSGVHYLTDIIGGLLLSAALVLLYISISPADSAQEKDTEAR